MPSRQSGCCLTAFALPMLCQNFPAQCPDNTSPNGVSPRGRQAQLLLELLPANGMKLGCVRLYCRCENASMGSQNEVCSDKLAFQKRPPAGSRRFAAHFAAFNHPVDGFGLLRRYIFVISEQGVLMDALQGR